MSQAEIDRMVQEAEKFRAEDETNKAKIEENAPPGVTREVCGASDFDPDIAAAKQSSLAKAFRRCRICCFWM